jgi:hypothetical protein
MYNLNLIVGDAYFAVSQSIATLRAATPAASSCSAASHHPMRHDPFNRAGQTIFVVAVVEGLQGTLFH